MDASLTKLSADDHAEGAVANVNRRADESAKKRSNPRCDFLLRCVAPAALRGRATAGRAAGPTQRCATRADGAVQDVLG